MSESEGSEGSLKSETKISDSSTGENFNASTC